MEQSASMLQRLRHDQLNQIKSLNGLKMQKFAQAERMLTYAAADLARLEQQGQAIVNRLAGLQAAETHLADALHLTEADLARLKDLRDREDPKIGPEVDRQIEQASHQLAEARRLVAAGEFITAVDVQVAARQLITAAYVAADEQVREINTLQLKLESLVKSAQEKKRRCLAEARKLPAVAQTDSTNRLGWQLRDELSRAEQLRVAAIVLEDRALAEALRVAIEAYEEVTQLAEWVAVQVTADRREYAQCLDQTLAALDEAQTAISQAKQVVHQSDAGGAGQHALYRAQTILSSVAKIENATKEALVRIRQQAEKSRHYTQQAEHLARRNIRLAQAERDRRLLEWKNYDQEAL
jgi:hypothetical protein